MHKPRVRLEPDLIARLELMALAKHGNDFFAAEFGEDLGLRAGRLDHDDFGLGAVVGDGEMLGTDAVNRGASVAAGRRAGERQLDAVRSFKRRAAVRR